MMKNTRVASIALVVVIAVLMAALGVLVGMLWANVNGSDSNEAKDASATAEVADPESATSTAVDPSPDDPNTGIVVGGGVDASPLAVDGELLPVGVPVDFELVDFFDDVHPMTITVDGVTQNGDCTIVLMQITPEADVDSFSLPTVGMVSDGLHYEGGACTTTGLEDAGYLSSIGLEAPAGQTVAYYDFAQRPGGALADVEAITVEVAADEYLFFEPVEKSLT